MQLFVRTIRSIYDIMQLRFRILTKKIIKSSEYKHCFKHVINMNLRKKILISINPLFSLAFYVLSTDGLEKVFVFKLITVVLSGCSRSGRAQGLGSVLSFVQVIVH